jgi:hypothetical protein
MHCVMMARDDGLQDTEPFLIKEDDAKRAVKAALSLVPNCVVKE